MIKCFFNIIASLFGFLLLVPAISILMLLIRQHLRAAGRQLAKVEFIIERFVAVHIYRESLTHE